MIDDFEWNLAGPTEGSLRARATVAPPVAAGANRASRARPAGGYLLESPDVRLAYMYAPGRMSGSNGAGPPFAERQQFFFVHLMKTGGTSFRTHAARNFAPNEIYPVQAGATDFARILQYSDVHQFANMDEGVRARTRFFSAHVPYSTVELVAPSAVTITIIRDPVERTLSYLRHCQRTHPEHQGMALEEIYEDEWFFARFIENRQTKMLSMSSDEAQAIPPDSIIHALNPRNRSLEELRADEEFTAAVARELSSGTVRALLGFDSVPAEMIEVDERRLALAKSTLAEVDALGTTDHLDELMDVVSHRYGLDFQSREILNRTDETMTSTSFRRRIHDDNLADVALYEQALTLRSRRGH